MSKVSGSYASITRGVSEQVLADRLPGQSTEMVNMVDSPGRGKSRRHGSITMDEQPIPGLAGLSPAQAQYARNYREHRFNHAGTEYSIIYMAGERASTDTLPFCFVLNKATGKFMHVVMGDAATLAPWTHGGISAITTVGRFVLLASAGLGPGYTEDDRFAATQQYAVAEVKAGAYSRTYTLKVERMDTGAVVEASYTTMASSYPELLDTSDIVLTGNNNYQKEVNDRVNDYNSKVNKWIGDAAASIAPQHIAQQLIDALAAQGFTDAARVGGTITLTNTRAVSASDGGDGTMFRGVAQEIDDAAKLSAIHKPGKVVRIAPKNASEPYYMVAHADTGASSDFQTVTWKEGAAQVITPGQVFALGAINDEDEAFYLTGSPLEMAAALGEEVPEYSASVCGDKDAIGAVPYFFGRRITHLTVFMDRLVIVANGTICMSRTGDYFNWFRASKLTVKDDDPIEMYALGAEDDVIHHSVAFARDLFLFGQRKQYTVSGRSALSPATASISVAANEADTAPAAPVVVGNLLFYGKFDAAANQSGPSPYRGSVHQFQLGLFQDTPETHGVSQQLPRYLRGKPVEMAALSAPNTLLVRTDGFDTGLYVYSFIDQPGTQQRAWDSWSRWQWHERIGRIIGLTTYEATIYVTLLRQGVSGVWVACEQFVMDGGTSVTPYLDMQRPVSQYRANTGVLRHDSDASVTGACVALADTVPRAWLGQPDITATAVDTLWAQWNGVEQAAAVIGLPFESSVTFTPPFVRDREDKAITAGRLIVTRYLLSVADTGALDGYLHSGNAVHQVLAFNGRKVGQSNNQVGFQPVTTATLGMTAGRANVEHASEIRARHWLPLTITALEWTGQHFLNTRRV